MSYGKRGYGTLADKWAQPIVQDKDLKIDPLKLPPHCPATLIQISENMVEGMFVAGGSCMTIADPYHQFTDFDIWTNNDFAKNHVESMLTMWGLTRKSDPKLEIQEFEDELVKVQIIHAPCLKSVADLISTFDIEACKIGFDNVSITCGNNTISDIQNKKITTNPVHEAPAKLLVRIIKYAAKGYSITPELVSDIWTKNQAINTETRVPQLTPENALMADMLKSIKEAMAKNSTDFGIVKSGTIPPWRQVGDDVNPDHNYKYPILPSHQQCTSCGAPLGENGYHICY